MIETKSLGLEEARKIVDAVLEYASVTKPGRPVNCAVVDNAGVLIYFVRMDGTSPISTCTAVNKAYTAIMWKRDTKDVFDLLKRVGLDIAYFGETDKQTPLPGGVLIRSSDDSIVGAVGVSGRSGDAAHDGGRSGKGGIARRCACRRGEDHVCPL